MKLNFTNKNNFFKTNGDPQNKDPEDLSIQDQNSKNPSSNSLLQKPHVSPKIHRKIARGGSRSIRNIAKLTSKTSPVPNRIHHKAYFKNLVRLY